MDAAVVVEDEGISDIYDEFMFEGDGNSSNVTSLDQMDNESDPVNDWTRTQHALIAILPRLASALSIICACQLARVTYQNRHKNIYHRLNFGMAIHIIAYGIIKLYGTLGTPEASNVWGTGYGTTATCSFVGFFAQVSYSISFYYVILSVYSFVAVRNNFQMAKYQWVEKWLHLAVHVYPVGSAIYLLSIEAFNNTGQGQCWIASKPFGCGVNSKDGIPCDRGPQNIERVVWLFAAIPTFFVLFFPTFVMLALYIEVKRKQSSIKLKSKTVAKQAVLYLAALYWSYLFTIINNGYRHLADSKVYGIMLASGLTINLQGVWFLLIYNHFHMKKKRPNNDTGGGDNDDYDNNMDDLEATGRSYHSQSGKQKLPPSNNKIEISLTDQDPSSNTGNGNGNGGGRDNGTVDTTFTFNIFDGTNATSQFSNFIYEGDSDDEAADQEQSVMWNAIQTHV